jgi:prenyltransferase beta subunit
MSLKAISAILRTDLSDQRKLQLISELIEFMSKFEAASKGVLDIEDETIDKWTSLRSLKLIPPDRQSVKAILHEGIHWLIKNRREDRGWGWGGEERGLASGSEDASMPWDTAMTTIALSECHEHRDRFKRFDFDDEKMKEMVTGGRQWLISNQGSDGGWGGLVTADSNAIETGISLFVLLPRENSDEKRAVSEGIDFLAGLRSKDGGVSLRKGVQSDVKSTALSVFINTSCQTPPEQIQSSVDWLLKHQESAGNWKWDPRSVGNIDATFYSAAALRLRYQAARRFKVHQAIQRAIHWYKDEAGFVRIREKVGWAWRDVENTAAAVTFLLDSDEPEFSIDIEKGVEWLIDQRDPENCWEADTPIVLLALIRYLMPETRLSQRAREFVGSS